MPPTVFHTKNELKMSINYKFRLGQIGHITMGQITQGPNYSGPNKWRPNYWRPFYRYTLGSHLSLPNLKLLSVAFLGRTRIRESRSLSSRSSTLGWCQRSRIVLRNAMRGFLQKSWPSDGFFRRPTSRGKYHSFGFPFRAGPFMNYVDHMFSRGG